MMVRVQGYFRISDKKDCRQNIAKDVIARNVEDMKKEDFLEAFGIISMI